MTSKKKDTFDSNAVQNRFTAYLITAIRRKRCRQDLCANLFAGSG